MLLRSSFAVVLSVSMLAVVGCDKKPDTTSDMPGATNQLRAPIGKAGIPDDSIKPAARTGGPDDSVKPVAKTGIPDDSIKPVAKTGVPDDSVKPVVKPVVAPPPTKPLPVAPR